jgi:exosortase
MASVALLVLGTLGAERFLARVSLIGVLAGAVLFVFGWAHLRILSFPLALLLLMIPIPAIVFNQIAFPLQLLASRAGQAGLVALDIPVLREGNIIVLAQTTLEVAEACSGIRSLISLLVLGIVVGYVLDPRIFVRVILALVTVPIAVVSNGMRVAGIGVAAHYYGASAAEGFMHTFSGWVVFLVAFVMLLGVYKLVAWVWPQAPRACSQRLNGGLGVVAGV